MLKKTITTDFFTTININLFLKSLASITYKLAILRKWNSLKSIENEFLSYIWNRDSKIVSFYSWRSAIFHALKMIWLKKTDEVIVSGYNCVTVSNAVIQSWVKIIYSDIESKTLWLKISKLKENITKKTKVIIVQHTFWKPSNINSIIKLAKANNILVIEDCAHSLWSEKNWNKLGSFWDFSIFSTWRDKVISSVTGWFLIINNAQYFSKIKKLKNKLLFPSIWLTIKNHLYNILGYFSYKLYDILKIGRFIMYISRKLGFITEILTKSEKECNFKDFNKKLPNSLLALISEQLKDIKKDSTYRKFIAKHYDKNINNKYIKPLFKDIKSEKNNYFRYPIILKSEELKNELYNYMRLNNVLLWKTWSGINIVPLWTNLKKVQYIEWTCSNAEKLSKKILLLPSHKWITFDEAKQVIKLLNNFKK